MTEPSRESIERFFRNECSAEEAEQVAAYLEQHPGLMDIYAGKEEWDAVQGQLPLSATLKEEMREKVYRSTRPPVRRIGMIRLTAAACIASLLILGSFWISSSHKNSSGKTLADSRATATVMHTRTLKNSGNDKRTFTTPDGSKIELAAHSECSYEEPFASNARDFRLKGEAVFDVAKDPARPFTVYAGGVATTVLGTSFRVRAVDNEPQIFVQLISGKVVVRQVPVIAERNHAELYLSPGEEMVFDRTRQTMALHSFPGIARPAEMVKKKISGQQGNMTETAETWTFYNQPLTEILRTLQTAYTTGISYSQKDLSKIRFTGTFNKSDSLSYILNTIGSISKLQVIKDGDSYKVEK